MQLCFSKVQTVTLHVFFKTKQQMNRIKAPQDTYREQCRRTMNAQAQRKVQDQPQQI